MTATEFLANADLVKEWKHQLTTNEIFKIVMEVLENENPLYDTIMTSESTALIAYGEQKGYARYAKRLKDLGDAIPLAPDPTKLPSTYSATYKTHA